MSKSSLHKHFLFQNRLCSIPGLLQALISVVLYFLFASCTTSGNKMEPSVEEDFSDMKCYTLFSPIPHYDTTHLTAEEKARIQIGKALFYDPRLSASGAISCATCHPIECYGVDGLPSSAGHRGIYGLRNAPTVLNSSLQSAQFWDARVRTLEEQWMHPLMAHREMAQSDTSALLAMIERDSLYGSFFHRARGRPLRLKALGNALGAFERILLTPGRWDRYLEGDKKALDPEEKRGLRLFVQWGCARCHSGTLLGGEKWTTFPGDGAYWKLTGSNTYDAGRYNVTGNPADKLVFKVPQLRNVAHTAPYFHDGSVPQLDKAIELMARGSGIIPVRDEIVAVQRFLLTLTGTLPKYDWLDIK